MCTITTHDVFCLTKFFAAIGAPQDDISTLIILLDLQGLDAPFNSVSIPRQSTIHDLLRDSLTNK